MAKELLRTLKGILKKRIYFSDFHLYILFMVYPIYTHVYQIFSRTPYYGIFGPKDSGKTCLGEFLEGVCFKGTQTSDITSAALYRYVDQEKGTFIIDEGLHNESRFDTLNRILRSGYRRNGRVICCEPGGGIATFSTFCPKTIIDKIEPSDAALSSRIISIRMTQSPNPIPKLLESEAQIELDNARDLITKFWKENREDLSEYYKSSPGFDEFSNRDGELWTPLLTVSGFLDSQLDTPFLLENMLTLARKLIHSKRRDDLENNLDLQILEGTQSFIEDKDTEPVTGNLYVAFQIRDFIRRRWDLRGLSTKKVVQTLKHYSVCGERKRPHILLSGISQPACYPIDTKTLSQIVDKYLDGGESR
jgi:hypothetical protein